MRPEDMLFPHEKERNIQKAFLMQVHSAISNRQNLVVHAPTGIGKTTVLAPALACALKKDLTVFFLTSRHTQHKIAIETLAKIKKKYSLDFGVADIVGKRWMCAVPGVDSLSASEFSEYCRDLREKGRCEYYNNVRKKGKISKEAEAAISKLHSTSPWSADSAVSECSSRNLCPYETACAAAQKAKVIIADFNHLLNKSIRESFMSKTCKQLNKSIIIVDEAHNLPQRARELMTSSISSTTVDFAVKEARQISSEMADDLESIKSLIDSMAKKLPISQQEMIIIRDDFYEGIEKIGCYEELAGNFRFIEEQVLENKKRSYVGSVANFMENWTGPDEGFVRILSRNFDRRGRPNFSLSYKCLDPSIATSEFMNRSYCTIAMSGTLSPVDMYADLFGLDDKRTITAAYGNPFPRKNRLNLIVPKTTTKYSLRSPRMYELISRELVRIIESVPGNIAVFFPSYNIRDEVCVSLRNKISKTSFFEQSSLSKREKEQMIEKFKAYKDIGAVLFGASSGSMGEGIDLPGDLLKAVVIVGLPLAKPDLETQELIKYYELKYGKGWDYGYVYPAIVRTMQNAGRCIRSETDRGVIVFLDERYSWPSYKKCFPAEWDMKVTRNPSEQINCFFGKNSMIK